MSKTVKSIEEKVEQIAKDQLKPLKYYIKTDTINEEIGIALKKAPSKSGGEGENYPDIKLLLQIGNKDVPVMIEVKGKKGDFVKYNELGEVENKTKDNKPCYANIKKYAVNGAIHYADAIIKYTDSYKDVIAIGVNGYYDHNDFIWESEVYYLSAENYFIPKKMDCYTNSDLSFLQLENRNSLLENIENLYLTDDEIQQRISELENTIEINLTSLNQEMQDTHQISEDYRVKLICGLIMAGLGVEKDGNILVKSLEIVDLKGDNGSKSHDGWVILNKIESFLNEKNIPTEKREMIIGVLSQVFIHSNLHAAINGESKLKKIYSKVKHEILPFFNQKYHIDFTGKLYNVLNAWVKVPDGNQNDVVLTPRYVTELMAKLAKVNKDSYVWDYATGSAGFLISSMKLMIKDAENTIKSPDELKRKIKDIKCKQLLGVEKLPDIYMLAVLNMLLMGDGSTNIIHKNSLTEFDGKYEQGENKDKDFPANVFLLNPPYSAEGRGFIFVNKALKRMSNGRAVVLIKDTAGSGQGLPYTKEILQKNSLIASIKMPDIFYGKAGVLTNIYVFDIGTPHNEKQIVKFIDFSNDGYERTDRKKAKKNLKNIDNAEERYEEIVNVILYGKQHLNYYTDEEYVEDTITLNGDDWTFAQHKKINTIPTENDFRKIVKDYLSWKIANIIKEGI